MPRGIRTLELILANQGNYRMSKRLNVLVSDEAALKTAIESIRDRATTWSHSASGIRNIAARAEARLETVGIPQTNRIGIEAVQTSEGPSANSYSYGVKGSKITLKRSKDGWRLVSYDMVGVYPKQGGKLDLVFQQKHHDAMLAALLRTNRITVKTERKEAA
jgi:hypothetical protein